MATKKKGDVFRPDSVLPEDKATPDEVAEILQETGFGESKPPAPVEESQSSQEIEEDVSSVPARGSVLTSHTLNTIGGVLQLLDTAASVSRRDHKRVIASHAIAAAQSLRNFLKYCDQAGYNPFA